jgi:lysophospholipase L1-like esterase
MPSSHPRRLTRIVLSGVLAVGVTAAASSLAGNAAHAATGDVYVAMGDSYSAGPLILPQSDPFTCVRSSANYPGLLAQAVPVATLRDVTCSSATTRHFAQPQDGAVSGTAAPQYDALTADTTLVTVGIGGNDVGLVGLATNCLNLLPAPIGKSCAAKYTAGGVDQYSQRIQAFAPTYGTVIEEIRRRAPQARILMVGYPTAIRNGGCFPAQPLLAPDATYIQAKIDELNAAMRQQSEAHGATYVDLRPSTVGHDACALPLVRWVEGLVPLRDAAPMHPNALGMRNAEKVVFAALGG